MNVLGSVPSAHPTLLRSSCMLFLFHHVVFSLLSFSSSDCHRFLTVSWSSDLLSLSNSIYLFPLHITPVLHRVFLQSSCLTFFYLFHLDTPDCCVSQDLYGHISIFNYRQGAVSLQALLIPIFHVPQLALNVFDADVAYRLFGKVCAAPPPKVAGGLVMFTSDCLRHLLEAVPRRPVMYPPVFSTERSRFEKGILT